MWWMQKDFSLKVTKKLRIFLKIGSLLATPLGMDAYEIQDSSLSKQYQPVIFSEVKGIEWVKECIQQYPEILWLADAQNRRRTSN
jgi:hypothetical protein